MVIGSGDQDTIRFGKRKAIPKREDREGRATRIRWESGFFQSCIQELISKETAAVGIVETSGKSTPWLVSIGDLSTAERNITMHASSVFSAVCVRDVACFALDAERRDPRSWIESGESIVAAFCRPVFAYERGKSCMVEDMHRTHELIDSYEKWWKSEGPRMISSLEQSYVYCDIRDGIIKRLARIEEQRLPLSGANALIDSIVDYYRKAITLLPLVKTNAHTKDSEQEPLLWPAAFNQTIDIEEEFHRRLVEDADLGSLLCHNPEEWLGRRAPEPVAGSQQLMQTPRKRTRKGWVASAAAPPSTGQRHRKRNGTPSTAERTRKRRGASSRSVLDLRTPEQKRAQAEAALLCEEKMTEDWLLPPEMVDAARRDREAAERLSAQEALVDSILRCSETLGEDLDAFVPPSPAPKMPDSYWTNKKKGWGRLALRVRFDASAHEWLPYEQQEPPPPVLVPIRGSAKVISLPELLQRGLVL